MIKKNFWTYWKRITPQEEKAVKVLKIGKKIVLENIPNEEIFAIYAKGSFIRREMNEKSDVDLFIILKTKRFLKKLRRISKKIKNDYSPPLNIGSGYTLWELKTGKRINLNGVDKPIPARINKHLPHYKLIYGGDVTKLNLFHKNDKILLNGFIKTFDNFFLPKYKKREFGFAEIVKQVFWLAEFEQRAKGKNPPHSWKLLKKSIRDKEHIIHLTYKYRIDKPKDKETRKEYIKKLRYYLKELKKLK
jgi:predicted nucleotidyltransferase